MSAAAVIDQIKKLSAPERREVFTFVATELASMDAVEEGQDSCVERKHDMSFEEARDRVFREHRELFRRLAQ